MADDVIFQSMQRIGAGPIQIFYSTHLGRCWLSGPESLRELASHNEDPGVAASIGFGRLLPGRGRAMAAPEDAQLRVVHGCRRIAGPRGGLGTGTVSERICRTGVRPKHLSAAGSSICFSIGREFTTMAVRTAITSRCAHWAGRSRARFRCGSEKASPSSSPQSNYGAGRCG